MNLLKDTPCTFRYALYHTSDNKILIVFIESNDEINEYSQTIVETLYENTIFLSYKINQSETIKVTCSQNQITMKQFDSDIISYCKKFTDTNEVRFINGSPNHELLFGVDVFTTIVNNTKELYLELGNSGLHIGEDSLQTLNKLTIQNGKLYPKSTANIYTKDLFIMNSEITVANKDEDSHSINFIVSSKINIIYLKIYSTITTVITAGSKEGENISNSSFISNYIEIYGEEKVNDTRERLGIFSFKSALIGELHVNDEVVVGNILKVDKIVSFTLNKFYRNILSMGNGYGVCIYRVANVNLSNLNYIISKNSDLPPEVSIVHFLKDTDSGLHKKIFLYDSEIDNPTDFKINMISMEETSVENIYISGCIVGNGITIINKDTNSEVLKMTLNEVKMDVSNNILFDNVEKLYLTNCEINTTGAINILCKYLSINGGLWYFDKCNIGKDNEIMFNVSIQEIELHGNEFNLLNDTVNSLDGKFFDNNSKFNIEKILISGYQTSLASTVLFSKSLICKCDKVLTLTRASIFVDKESSIKTECSLSGILMVNANSEDDVLNITLSDVQRFLQNNTLDIISISGESATVKFNTNATIKLKMVNDSNENLYINYLKDFESEQNSKITFVPLFDRNIDYKVMTNTEKIVSINKIENKDDNNNILFEVIKK